MVKWQLGNYYRPCHAGRTIDELGSTSEQFYSGTDINMAGRSCLKHSPDQHFDAYGGSRDSMTERLVEGVSTFVFSMKVLDIWR
jgi:hypothetical protein